eukprot:TRINITY_DN5263_c0_g1_i4.p1 TRINITY_DN5263_c0_g1~~TRINITY_DN5263_c0_g1_i4.p1  ORF type:complete len:104 (-),score=16.84 TRINITY_DN5263_c0_g1_i4:174-485(-)
MVVVSQGYGTILFPSSPPISLFQVNPVPTPWQYQEVLMKNSKSFHQVAKVLSAVSLPNKASLFDFINGIFQEWLASKKEGEINELVKHHLKAIISSNAPTLHS